MEKNGFHCIHPLVGGIHAEWQEDHEITTTMMMSVNQMDSLILVS